jgi:MFS family permease
VAISLQRRPGQLPTDTNDVEPAHPWIAERVLRFGIGLAIAGVAVQTVAHLSYALVFDYDVPQLNLDAEQNVFSWASTVTTFAAATGALLLAVLGTHSRRYFFLAAALAMFSLDDSVELHERLGESATEGPLGLSEDVAHAVWPLVFFPALALVFVLLALTWRESTGQIRSTLGFGLVLLVMGIGVEALQGAWYGTGREAESLLGALQITVEESAELAGWILIATGLLTTACVTLLRLGARGNRPANGSGQGLLR